jgi:flavin reductase (DIM6/NTAB) family NADH-FMN oxidoreductase RutF
MIINLDSVSKQEAFVLMTASIIPRPIAWVLSENIDGGLNIGPFSFFNAVTSNPPLLMISAGINPDGSYKDTLYNIRDRHQFVIHIVSLEQIQDMNQSAEAHAPGVSEVELLGLKTTPLEGFRLPRLTDSRVAFACSLHDIHYVGNDLQALILAKIDKLYLDDAVVGEDAKGRLKINAEQINPVARMGPNEYVKLGELIHLQRPK